MSENLSNGAPEANGGILFLWGLLGCCVPIAGLVLFLAWRDEKPKTAKAAGIGALISVILLGLLTLLYIVLIAFSIFVLSSM